ncbi:MAG: PilZ domain-containing protein [Phycisphaerales bacterium]|nr:PilZ domain-containing protein [Phycisphaerales bacterium]MCI0674351.1 PilZ domain-containing protein [Phycisphaerales bacterium]
MRLRRDGNKLKVERRAPVQKPRRYGRLPQEHLRCNLGEIIDISAGGMCVVSDHFPPLTMQISFTGYTLLEPLVAQRMWCKPRRGSKWEVGLKFVDVTPALAEGLTFIARAHRLGHV